MLALLSEQDALCHLEPAEIHHQVGKDLWKG